MRKIRTSGVTREGAGRKTRPLYSTGFAFLFSSRLSSRRDRIFPRMQASSKGWAGCGLKQGVELGGDGSLVGGADDAVGKLSVLEEE